jgi:ubiquinone/menaquinone biosynthesis C-methylase UbiE
MTTPNELVNCYDHGPYHWFLPYFYARKRERIIELMAHLLNSSDTVLDIGSGDGRLTSLLASPVRSVVGLDHQMLPLRFARLLIQQDNIRLCRGDAKALCWRDEAFDVVTCLDTIEHIPSALVPRFLDEVQRVLRSGAMFVVSTPNRDNLHNRLWGHHLNPKHYFEYNLTELSENLTAHGFLVERTFGIYVPPPVLRRYLEHYANVFPTKLAFLLLIRLGRKLPGWSETQLVIARKAGGMVDD